MSTTSKGQFLMEPRVSVPLVSVVISARNRADDLGLTLRHLAEQTYPAVELIVIDDASLPSLERTCHAVWPGVRYIRNQVAHGYIVNRSLGMQIARGEYILSLDDDSNLTEPEDLARAVARMQEEREIGIMTFFVHQGALGRRRCDQPNERYVHTFIGCAHLIRKRVVEMIGSYRDFYFYYGEEAEYSLRVLDAGWRILFFPTVQVDHRISWRGRNGHRILQFSFRNTLWTLVLHFPWRRVLAEGAWKMTVFAWEAIRLRECRCFVKAMRSFLFELPTVLRLRKVIAPQTLLLFDALRFSNVSDFAAMAVQPTVSLREIYHWFAQTWMERPKAVRLPRTASVFPDHVDGKD